LAVRVWRPSTTFEPRRTIFVGLSALFIGLPFRKLYLTNPTCEIGKPCSEENMIRKQRVIFWSLTPPLIALFLLRKS
jgi:mercuric ion transport protein